MKKPCGQFVFGGDRLGRVSGAFLCCVASEVFTPIYFPFQERLTWGFTDEVAVCNREECP